MVNGFSCIQDFPKFSGGGPRSPPYKGNTSIEPSNSFFNNNSSQRQRKRIGKSAPIKTRNLSLGYAEIEKRRRALGQDLFCVICNRAVWNFDLLQQKTKSVIAALSIPEHCLSFYFVCDDQVQISWAVWLRRMENLAVTFCYLWLTEKLWLLGATAPHSPP